MPVPPEGAPAEDAPTVEDVRVAPTTEGGGLLSADPQDILSQFPEGEGEGGEGDEGKDEGADTTGRETDPTTAGDSDKGDEDGGEDAPQPAKPDDGKSEPDGVDKPEPAKDPEPSAGDDGAKDSKSSVDDSPEVAELKAKTDKFLASVDDEGSRQLLSDTFDLAVEMGEARAVARIKAEQAEEKATEQRAAEEQRAAQKAESQLLIDEMGAMESAGRIPKVDLAKLNTPEWDEQEGVKVRDAVIGIMNTVNNKYAAEGKPNRIGFEDALDKYEKAALEADKAAEADRQDQLTKERGGRVLSSAGSQNASEPNQYFRPGMSIEDVASMAIDASHS